MDLPVYEWPIELITVYNTEAYVNADYTNLNAASMFAVMVFILYSSHRKITHWTVWPLQ